MSKQLSENRCQFIRAEGKHCRMPRSETHASLCTHHARQEQRNAPLDFDSPDPALTQDLLGPVHDFRSAASVNHVLGKLLVLLNTSRISPRNAAVTAYICQLLLQSLPDVKQELFLAREEPDMQEVLKHILEAPSPGATAVKMVDRTIKMSLNEPLPTPRRISRVARPAHRATLKSIPSVPPVHPEKPQAAPPSHPRKPEPVPPAVAAAHRTKALIVRPPQPAKSEPVLPVTSPAHPAIPQPFGRIVLPAHLAKSRLFHVSRED